MMRTMTVGLLLAFAMPAFASDRPPRFDVDALCNARALTPDGVSPESKAMCMSTQGDAFDAVRRVWAATPVFIQDDCSYRAKFDGDGDYEILETCVRAQNRQQQDNQGVLTPKPKAKPAVTPK